MRVFIISVVVAVVIAAGGAIILTGMNKPVSEAFTTPSVRV